MIDRREKLAPRTRPRGTLVGKMLVPAALALALLTSACDKCGDYFWQGGAKTCHDDSQPK